MLRLHDQGMSGRNCSTEFQAIPLPSLGSPGQEQTLELAASRTRPGLSARGRDPFRRSTPSPEAQLGRCYNFFALSWAVSLPRPAQPVSPSPSLVGSCPPPCGSTALRGLRAGSEAKLGGIGGSGREEKGKAEVREIKRREGSR